METRNHWYLHVDLDAFFASVEQLDHPEYKGKPVIVGGKPEDKRSVVSTASYEARKFGVHSAMPTFQAYKLCPQGIFVHGRMKRYSELSYQIMSIFREYSPDVDQMSIDEAFIDITGTEKLFGPPEETAMKIKRHVKQNTGLTVSVGLATTKYLAKIASGFSKPDGFYFIKPGTEQEFMLNLPLNKVWGVGTKTLEVLKKSGIYSTRDIYEKSYDALEFLFGKNTANFLYNTVRGIDTVNFGHEAKKHSISSETTFVDDIKDTYTAETELMELCQSVIFRLLKDEAFSRTAFLKIRYDDFSTVSIQKTVDRSFLTLDSFFEIIKQLFEEKYEPGRGIRLLGVGFDNIDKEDKPYQQDLFATDNTKKQAVEKAILSLEKKHPEIKIHKARTLNKKLSLLLFWGMALFSGRMQECHGDEGAKTQNAGGGTVYSDSFLPPPESESPGALFNYKLSDKNTVDFFISGYWQSNLSGSTNYYYGNETSPFISTVLPVFTQEVDLSTKILLNNKWYFEGNFADQFTKNTIALGYNGDKYLKSLRISNRGIKMPSYYSAHSFGYSLEGGNNQAPGISLHFSDIENSRWFGDFLFRYDMTKTNSAVFYGKNSVSDSKIPINEFLYSKDFIFPQEVNSELAKIKSIYIEDKNGSYTDKNHKKYKKLSNSDYAIIQSLSKISFSQNVQNSKITRPTIIITFYDTSSVSKIINATGSYSDNSTFKGKIQNFFNTYQNTQIDLSKYEYNLETQIENSTGLIIQNSSLFSPFACMNIYDCGLFSQADLFVQSISSEKNSTEYTAEQVFFDNTSLSTDFFNDNHLYAQVFNTNFTDKSLQNPQNRYPFADTNPEIYLNLPYENDFAVIVRNYSPVSDFQITTEAIEGTVQVFINNNLDSGATYNCETGIIELSKQVSNNDKIFITWQEDNSNFGSGSLAIGSGLFFNITNKLQLDFSLTSRWPLYFSEKYSTVDSLHNGFTAFTTGFSYNGENFSFIEQAALSVNSDNTSGNLLVMEQNTNIPSTTYLSSSDGFVTNALPDLSLLGKTLQKNKNNTIKKHNGITDSQISGYKIPLQFDFSSVNPINYSNSEPFWASVDVHLENGSNLKNSSFIELALFPDFENKSPANYEVYLQLGVKAENDFSGEDFSSVITWKISGNSNKNVISALDISSPAWQTIKILLTDEDRSKLITNYDARLLIVYTPSIQNINSSKGTLFFGPYEIYLQNIFTTHNNSIAVHSYITKAFSSPSANELSISENYSTQINWNVLDSTKINNDSIISASSYFKSADFSSYKTINFDFATTQIGTFSLILQDDETEAIKLTISDLSQYISQQDSPKYHKLSINIEEKKVFIDDIPLNSSQFSLEIAKKIIPNKAIFNFNIKNNDSLLQKGQFYIGNLYYSQTETYYNFQNRVHAKYEKAGSLISLNNYDILKNVEFSITSMQSPSAITADSSVGFTLTNIRYEADINTNLEAGHKIQTTKEFPSFLNFSESYRYNPVDNIHSKTDSAEISFIDLPLPLSLNFETSANNSFTSQSQESVLDGSISKTFQNSKYELKSNYKTSQKINIPAKTNNLIKTENNYFETWYDISQIEFSTGDKNASYRNQTFSSSLRSQFVPLSFSPELSYTLQTNYQNILEKSIQDITNIKILLPFSFTNNNFSFEISRTGDGIALENNSNSYFSDMNAISKSFNSKQWIYTSIPFYDLFDKQLPAKVSALLQNEQTNSYESLYQFQWNKKLTNSLKDLFIPSSSTFAFSRNIKSGIEQSDLYQIKCILSTNAINCFGKDSNLKLFEWYKQDEILSSITGIMKLPVDNLSSPEFNFSYYIQTLFYISDESILKTGSDFFIETSLDWNLRTTFVWTRPGKTSLLTDLLYKFINNKKVIFEIKRNDIFNFSLEKTDDNFSQKYEIIHNTDYNFLKYYSITSGIGTNLFLQNNYQNSLGITLSIGAKIVF